MAKAKLSAQIVWKIEDDHGIEYASSTDIIRDLDDAENWATQMAILLEEADSEFYEDEEL